MKIIKDPDNIFNIEYHDNKLNLLGSRIKNPVSKLIKLFDNAYRYYGFEL